MGIDDKDYQLDAAIERHQEKCPHENGYVDSIKVTIQSKPFGDLETWQKYLATQGTELFEVYMDVVCEECGARQDQWVSIDELVDSSIDAEWQE